MVFYHANQSNKPRKWQNLFACLLPPNFVVAMHGFTCFVLFYIDTSAIYIFCLIKHGYFYLSHSQTASLGVSTCLLINSSHTFILSLQYTSVIFLPPYWRWIKVDLPRRKPTLKGVWPDQFWIHPSKWSFWYQKKAPIFLITSVKSYGQEMLILKVTKRKRSES